MTNPLWDFQSTTLDDRTKHVAVFRDQAPSSVADIIALWRENQSFRSALTAFLQDVPFEAYRWETPCVTAATLSNPFEFVLLNVESLIRSEDPQAFSEHFDPNRPIVTISNLGGDATMVVPCPVGSDTNHSHLAAFLRSAPEAQVNQLWIEVARAMESRVDAQPVWLSTAGMGVSWLHVRLDDRPKYYGHAPYRKV